MAVDDRDWYRDALRKREEKEHARYHPNQFRGKQPPHIPQFDNEPPAPTPPESKVHWIIVVMACAAIIVIVMAIMRNLHR